MCRYRAERVACRGVRRFSGTGNQLRATGFAASSVTGDRGLGLRNLLRSVERSPAFEAAAAPYLLLDRALHIQAANQAYLDATGRVQEELKGEYVFEAFPDNPADPAADGVRNLGASFEQVLRSSQRDHMYVQRYDVPGPNPDDPFVLKYWSPVNSPVRDERGRAVGILHHVEDVTRLWEPVARGLGASGDVLERETVAEVVTTLVNNHRAYERLATEAAQLRRALSSRILIEQAKGIVMAERGCGPEEAFELLRRQSRNSNTKIHDLAAALVAGVRRRGSDRG